VASIQAKKVFLEIPSVTPSRPVRKVVYGTSISENTAPLQVKLVDAKDPTQDQKVNEIRNRLLLLRSKRDRLKVLAPVRGEVVEINAVGTQVARLDNLVKIKPIR
jgi:glycine cleavage system H lipoate-binding protein